MSQKNTSLLVIEVKNLFRTFAQNLAGDWNYKKIYMKKKKKKKTPQLLSLKVSYSTPRASAKVWGKLILIKLSQRDATQLKQGTWKANENHTT